MDRETLDFSTAFFQDFENSPEDFPGDRVDFIDKSDSFTYSQFFRDYLLPNRPCVFSAEFTKDWSSRKFWVTQDGKPNLERLLQEFQGAAPVPVANCDRREYNSHPKELLPFPEFVEYWREFISNGHRSSRGCLYLKDWHLSRAFPEREFYSIPVYFSSDWLNEYWDAVGADDFRFVYMGPKGSCWSANVCGRKRWLLYPPGEERFLTDIHGNLPFDLTAPEFRDPRIYPRSGRARAPLEIIQEAGEIVFVPSGWHHQVHNLEDTISINHNWLNGCSVGRMWRFLREELGAVRRELSRWHGPDRHDPLQCQLLLKSCTGIDFPEFYNFLRLLAESRLALLENRECSSWENSPGSATGLGTPQNSQSSVPALETPQNSQGSVPTLGTPQNSQKSVLSLNSQSSVPTLETPQNSQESVPMLETPQNSQSSVPTLGIPQNSQNSVPALEIPQNSQGSVSTLETPQNSQSSVPSLNSHGSVPTLGIPQNSQESVPSLETPQNSRGSIPTLETPQNSQSSVPTLGIPQNSQNSVPSLETLQNSQNSVSGLEIPQNSQSSVPTLETPQNSRSSVPSQNSQSSVPSQHSRGSVPALGIPDAVFDLQRLAAVLRSFIANREFQRLPAPSPPPPELLRRLEKALDTALLGIPHSRHSRDSQDSQFPEEFGKSRPS
ncbi:2-oxoglutarate and iron-dependent oxygenase JMJD4 isoform X2 [Poecile atricapillus]|uniref:2-oxoglutarate and iron-dependent oxygenase JMJD4 isoform X2 n=1 Tax=Poecile atricapillus TaxID=48891 RepID=UPI00273A55AD|nr:2-oxoglutarate and iron-dependent oxygenase JMJD4 isoform X2 [Poecile atricapillus]